MGVQTTEARFGVITAALTPVSVAATTTAEQSFTIAGLAIGDIVVPQIPAVTANVGIVNARVSAANTLTLTYVNANASPTVPAAGTYRFLVFRPEYTQTAFNV